MDISNAPHLIKIVKAVGDLEKINICEVDNECTVPPFNDSDAFKFVGKNISLVNLLTVLVFQPRELAHGGGINFII